MAVVDERRYGARGWRRFRFGLVVLAGALAAGQGIGIWGDIAVWAANDEIIRGTNGQDEIVWGTTTVLTEP